MAAEMIKALKALYRRRGAALSKELKSFRCAGTVSLPLLIDPSVGAYAHSQPRWLVVGKETNGWGQWKSGTPINSWIENSLELYRNFNLCRNHQKKPFWRATYEIGAMSGKKDKPNFLWTNLIKFDVDGKRVPDELEEISFNAFNVLSQEIEIIAPNAVIFFVGKTYEARLNEIFHGIKYEEIPKAPPEFLYRCIHPGLPYNSFWTFHPRYLSHSRNWAVVKKLGQLVTAQRRIMNRK